MAYNFTQNGTQIQGVADDGRPTVNLELGNLDISGVSKGWEPETLKISYAEKSNGLNDNYEIFVGAGFQVSGVTVTDLDDAIAKMLVIVSAAVASGLGTTTVIIDNLTSTSTGSALSANQGKILKDAADVEATETLKGKVELATAAETTTGTDALKAVHPAGLKVELDKKTNSTIATTNSDASHDLVADNSGTRVKVAPDALKTIVTGAAPVDGTEKAYFVGQLFFDNVNDKLYKALTKSTDPDSAATGSTFAEFVTGVPANDLLFADDTTVAPATAGKPTPAEIATFAAANVDTIVKYTGTDVSTDTSTRLYYRDASGAVTLLNILAGPTISNTSTLLVADNAGEMELVNRDALKDIITIAAPIDGTTVAYFAGQKVWDKVGKVEYEVLTPSTNPDAAATGSTFVVVATAAGGLTQQGVIPASITAQGIFTAEGTNAAATVYAATGSQDRVMVSSTAAGIGTVISVQTGEYLNGVLNGTYTTQSDGEILLFLDNAAGKWTVQVVGASASLPLTVSSLTVPDTGSALQTLTAGTSGTSYAGARVMTFGNTGEVVTDPTGVFDTVNDYIEFKKAGEYRISARIDIEDAGGSATSGFMFIGDQTNAVRTSILTTAASYWGSYSFDFIETFAIGDRLDLRGTHGSGENHDLRNMDIIIAETNNTVNVMAGMASSEPLDHIRVSLSASATPISDGTYNRVPFDTVDDAGDGNITLNADGTFTFLAGIKYELTAFVRTSSDASPNFWDFTGNVELLKFSSNTSTNNQTGSMTTVFKPAVDSRVGMVLASVVSVIASSTYMIVKSIALKSVTRIDSTLLPVNNAGVADTDILRWNAANTQYEPETFPASLVSDQSASNYIDLGEVRIQWGKTGTQSGLTTITMPAAMKDTNYSVNLTAQASSSVVLNGQASNLTTTTFDAMKFYLDAGGSGNASEDFFWTVVGLRP